MATKYAGRNGLVYCDPNGTGAAMVMVGALRAFTLDGTTDKIDVTEFGALNKTAVLGFPAARGTMEGFWASDDNTMRQASLSLVGCFIAVYPSSTQMTRYYGGPAWLDMSLRTAVDQAVTTTYNWEARATMINQL
jgi:hypothetical protein